MTTERNVVDFKIHNLTEEQFQELKTQGKIDPNAVYCTPDESLKIDQITNCITEIPQNIKLELTTDSFGASNLIIKAGSKLYYPNGSGVFDEVMLTADRAYTDTTKTGQWLVCLTQGLTGVSGLVANSVSGTTKPTDDFSLWYNTEENIMYRYGSISSDPISNVSLPIAIVTLGNTGVVSIDEVFNGFGYIGSTIFGLPGVKGLIPNERNADGTLKNTAWETSQVFTRTFTGSANFYVFCNGTNFPLLDISAYEYKKQENINWNNAGQQKYAATLLGVLKAQSGGKITSFETKTAFHAVDYNDYQNTKAELTSSINNVDSNAVHKTGDETINDVKTFTSEVRVSSQNAYRIVGASYGSFWRQDNQNLYLMLTNANDPMGSWNNLRPFVLDLQTGMIKTTTPSITSDDTTIATTEWANAKFLPLAGGTLTGNLNAEGKQVAAGYIELKPTTTSTNGGFIDFHYAGSTADYTSRIIEDASGRLSITASNGVKINNAPAATVESQGFSSVNSFQKSGHVKFTNGLIAQWGVASGGTSVEVITLPVPFSSNESYAVALGNMSDKYEQFQVYDKSATGFSITWTKGGGVSSYWIAIGI